VNGSLNIVDG